MSFYFAPMEGVTGYIYRNAHHRYFGGVSRYYAPFIALKQNEAMSTREQRDVMPENNREVTLIPQLLTNRADLFLRGARELEQLGYTEVNFNLGCPSGTVVPKKKGAGFLSVPDQLEHFLEEIFAKCPIDISIKTRLGIEQPEEFEDILDLYNDFPLKELIVHARVQKDMYNNTANWDAFALAADQCKCPLCYNGDIFSVEDYRRFRERFPQVENVMLGRGLLRNPALACEMQGQNTMNKTALRAFHDEILQNYRESFSGDKPVLFKMKELWLAMLPLFQGGDSYLKKFKKVDKLSQYENLVSQLFGSEQLVKR